MDLSIVTTMFCSAPYIKEFHERVTKEASRITDDYEIILVNDGSPDDSLGIALQLQNSDDKLKIIDLSRNFGHYKAIMTGLSHASGELIFLIDCDLEEKPELLGEFIKAMKDSWAADETKGADVVYGVQKSRKGKYFERITGSIFYKVFNLMSSYPIPENALIARLMTGRYVSSLLEYRDQEVFLDGIQALAGYRQIAVPTDKLHKGDTTYNLRRKLSVFVNSVTSFSNRPLIYIFFLGIAISASAAAGTLYVIIKKLIDYTHYKAGWPSMIASLWLIGGLIIFCIGVLGIYLSKIYMETKDRPYTIIRKIYEKKDK